MLVPFIILLSRVEAILDKQKLSEVALSVVELVYENSSCNNYDLC